LAETAPPETNVLWFTTVTYVRLTYVMFVTLTSTRERVDHQGRKGSLGASGNHPT
jgi:hypothetical protein